MKNFGNVLWGIVLIVIGLILGGNALGITNINIFFEGWWTLFIIIPCFIGLFKDNEKTASLIGLLVGVALLLGCQNIISFDLIWKLAFPTILVVLGLSMIFKDALGVKCDLRNAIIESDVVINANATFGGIEIYVPSNVKIKIKSIPIFGGVDNKASTKTDENSHTIYINSTAIFGGVEIK